MDFLEFPRFPDIALQQVSGGPCFFTEVVQLGSGQEQRNAGWTRPLHRYEISSSMKTPAELQAVLVFFEHVRGRWLPFRFKDLLDFSSALSGAIITVTDQIIGTGDGVQCAFQLIKTTKLGELTQVRVIQKPVQGTVMVAVDGIEEKQLEIDTTTGVITFAEPPPQHSMITAGFEFDVPCRFDQDQFFIHLQPGLLGSFTAQLTEVRLPVTALAAKEAF